MMTDKTDTTAYLPHLSNSTHIVLDRQNGWVYSNMCLVPSGDGTQIFKYMRTGALYCMEKVHGEEAAETLRSLSLLFPDKTPVIDHIREEYINSGTVSRFVPITRASISLRKRDPSTGQWMVDIGEETRLALKPSEQTLDKLPWLLPDEPLLYPSGDICDDVVIGLIIYKNQYKSEWTDQQKNKGQKLCDEEIPAITDDEALAIVKQAREDGVRFGPRHFKIVVWCDEINRMTNGKGGDASLGDVVLRVLREKLSRKPKYNWVTTTIKPVLLYKRPGGRSYVVSYVIDLKDTLIDSETIKNKGLCNYFSPRKCPEICLNDLFETRNHRFVYEEDALRELTDFKDKFTELGCNLSQCGALELFEEMRPHIFTKDN